MASKLVISVLRQIYVPPVLLHQHENGTYDVVDGKQRMTSLIIYIMGVCSHLPCRERPVHDPWFTYPLTFPSNILPSV